jgi:hypothetical protein
LYLGRIKEKIRARRADGIQTPVLRKALNFGGNCKQSIHMKHLWTIVNIFIIVTSCTRQAEKNVNYGFITDEWTYKNTGLKLDYPLPKGWYLLDASSKKYVRVGTDIKNAKAYTIPFQVSMQNFKESNTEQIAILFAITKLDTSTTFVTREFDYNADKTISLGLVYSDNEDIYAFLRNTCLKCTDEGFKDIYLKNVKLGNVNFDGYITGVKDNQGNKNGKFFGVRRIGNLYLVCQYYFANLNSFDTYKDYFKGLTIK